MDLLGNFKYNGIDSSSFGLLVNYENIAVKPLKRSFIANIIGKDGAQIFSDQYDIYEIVFDCRLKGDIHERRRTAREIAAWLNVTGGDLVLGVEQDVKYTAYPLTESFARLAFVLEDFFLSLWVQPIKKSTLEGDDLVWETADIAWDQADIPWDGYDFVFYSITSGDTLQITNGGNYKSLPTMKISGQATTLSITDDNGIEFTFSGLNGTIYVDSENFLVYSGNNPKVNEILNSNGEFISLNVGLNTIDVTGTGFVNLEIEFIDPSAYL